VERFISQNGMDKSSIFCDVYEPYKELYGTSISFVESNGTISLEPIKESM
jgi:hypothetical protein